MGVVCAARLEGQPPDMPHGVASPGCRHCQSVTCEMCNDTPAFFPRGAVFGAARRSAVAGREGLFGSGSSSARACQGKVWWVQLWTALGVTVSGCLACVACGRCVGVACVLDAAGGLPNVKWRCGGAWVKVV